MSDLATPLSAPIVGIDFAALAAWMDEQNIGWGSVNDARLLAGGTQNILLRFRRGDKEYVLRRPPVSLRANSNETMRREARVLGAIAGSRVPHPHLVAACSDEAVIAAVFYLMEPVEGFTATNGLPPLHANDAAARHRMGLAMVEAIAALGSIDYQAVGLEGFGRPENYLERQVDRWKAQLASYGGLAGWPGPGSMPGVDTVAKWLETHRPSLPAWHHPWRLPPRQRHVPK